MQLKKKVIGPAGQVVWLSLATGKTITSTIGNSYKDLVELEKKGRGWIDYAECPDNSCEDVPALELRGAKDKGLCKTCAAREALIRTRVKAKNLENADYAKMFETNLDKLAKVLEANMMGAQAPKLTDEQLQAAMATPVPEKPKRQTK